VASETGAASGRRPVASDAESSKPIGAAGAPSLARPDELGSPGDGQMNGPTYRVTLEDLIKNGELRTKEDWRSAAEVIAWNRQLFGEADPELLAKIKVMADQAEA